MPGTGAPRILSRVRSHRKMRTATAEQVEASHRRQHSDSATASSSTNSEMEARTHRPAIEWDPLKLNPPTPPVAAIAARHRDSLPEYRMRRKRSFAGHETRRPRMHHSDSGFSLVVHDGFDFGFERDGAGAMGGHAMERHRSHEDEIHMKGWPSPTSSVDSGKSWFEHNDDDDNEDGAVARSNQLWGAAPPSPRRRPQVASPDDPNYFIQRGGWKRRGIVFGGQAEQVRQKDEEVFNII